MLNKLNFFKKENLKYWIECKLAIIHIKYFPNKRFYDITPPRNGSGPIFKTITPFHKVLYFLWAKYFKIKAFYNLYRPLFRVVSLQLKLRIYFKHFIHVFQPIFYTFRVVQYLYFINRVHIKYPNLFLYPSKLLRNKAPSQPQLYSTLNLYFFSIFFYQFFKKTLLAIILAFVFFTYFLYFFQLQFLKQFAIWFITGNLILWLFSGFNFFLKRYKFGKFTAAIQRFWKRTNMVFWLIEGFLFLIFFYYYLNASQEATFFYDFNINNKSFLLNLRTGFTALLYLTAICYVLYYLLLNLSNFNFNQISFTLGGASLLIFLIFFLESYQIYYVLTSFSELTWVEQTEFALWCADFETNQMRVKSYYFTLCLIAKYWHFLFIFLSWVFFLIKSFETKVVTYNLLAVNLQNIFILYILNLCCYSQYILFILRRFYDLPYFWFFTNLDTLNLQFMLTLIKNLIFSLFYLHIPCNWITVYLTSLTTSTSVYSGNEFFLFL